MTTLSFTRLSLSHLTLTKGSAANTFNENNIPMAYKDIDAVNLLNFIIFSFLGIFKFD